MNPREPLAYVQSSDRYFARAESGTWDTQEAVTKNGAASYLHEWQILHKAQLEAAGYRVQTIKELIGALPEVPGQVLTAFRVDRVPTEPGQHRDVVIVDGQKVLTTYMPPKLPAPGQDWPTVRGVLEYLTGEFDTGAGQWRANQAAFKWLVNWIAFKVRFPAEKPRTTIFLHGPQGSGKSTLFLVLAQLLGPANCGVIEQADLESPYNADWSDRLLILADECGRRGAGNRTEVDGRLKALTTSGTVQKHAKYANQRRVTSRFGLIIASNLPGALHVEDSDRRYTVLSNMTPVSPAHKQRVSSLFVPGKTDEFTSAALAEIAAFDRFLRLEWTLDTALVRTALENGAREDLKEMGRDSCEAFVARVLEDGGFAGLEDAAMGYGFWEASGSHSFKIAGRTFLTGVHVFNLYRGFCREAGYDRPFTQGALLGRLEGLGLERGQETSGKPRRRGWACPEGR